MRSAKRNHEWTLRNLLLLLAGIVSLGLLVGCMSSGGFRPGSAGLFLQKPSLIPGSFEDLWEARTIFPTKSFETPSLLSAGGSGRRGGFDPFPLTVHATFMDSALIERGLDLYTGLADLSALEARAYRNRYHDDHHTGEYLYVWAELTTRYHESYLQLDRWIFFLENESGQQFEPVQVVEKGERRREFFPGLLMAGPNPDQGHGPAPRTSPALPERQRVKIVEFYFPRTSFYGAPVVGPNTRTIDLVVVSRENLDERAAGTWHFNRF